MSDVMSCNVMRVAAGYSQEPPGSQEEEELLSRLLRASVSGSPSQESDELMAAVMALAGTHAQCQQCGVAEDHISAIQAHVMGAVGSLKQKVASPLKVPEDTGI